MACRRIRTRLFDVMIFMAALACLSAPIMVSVNAASTDSDSLLETGMTVDQKVRQTGLISLPLNGAFELEASGKSSGKVEWDVYSSAAMGFKLALSTDGSPAMRDEHAGVNISDLDSSPDDWQVGVGDRRFGFSVDGDQSLSAYANGTKWRGFNGHHGIEVARRRAGANATIRTTIKLASEMRSPVPTGVKPKTWIVATAMLNI